jgi:hypothetical protein
MARQRSVRQKPLYLAAANTLTQSLMGLRANCDPNRPGFMFWAGGLEDEFDGGISSSAAIPHRQGQSTPPTEHKVNRRNMGTLTDRSGLGTRAHHARLAQVSTGDGACVVVRARESRVHGEGRQGTDGAYDDAGTIRGHG